MPVMLEHWNDDKMDALDVKVDALAAQPEKGFKRVDAELREQRRAMKVGFERSTLSLWMTFKPQKTDQSPYEQGTTKLPIIVGLAATPGALASFLKSILGTLTRRPSPVHLAAR